jgi:peptidoglycan/xylan/chitin deacetylase (PgdA/CDA1 family)
MNGYQLPAFDLDEYAALLDRLGASYTFDLISNMRNADLSCKIVYMRHDIDLHIPGVEQMASLEARHGVQATFYVPLTLHFNPLYPENQHILRQICDLGHEIGLHYDMETFPVDPVESRRYLTWEADILGKIVGRPVRTICMHQPRKGEPDPFCEVDEYVHPHDPRYQKNLVYISDSCRAWRDESLLFCFDTEAPRRLLLNTHPESWLDGRIADRIEYLDQVLMVNGVRQHREYFDQIVRRIWLTHPAPRLHDERQRRKTGAH